MANDLISREAALEAAKTGLKNFVGIQWTPENRRYVPKVVHGVRDALQNVPAIDAVPVIRCQDCKHWKPSGSWGGDTIEDMQPLGGCRWTKCCRRASDYCSMGERRSDT